MEIKHNPEFDIDVIAQHYSKVDGVDVVYVCTSEVHQDDVPMDIFYRETPHPIHGNRYLGIYYDGHRDNVYVCNADDIEQKVFGLVEGDDGCLHYSRYRHEYIKFENGNMIDGGRAYVKSSGLCFSACVHNGELILEKDFKP